MKTTYLPKYTTWLHYCRRTGTYARTPKSPTMVLCTNFVHKFLDYETPRRIKIVAARKEFPGAHLVKVRISELGDVFWEKTSWSPSGGGFVFSSGTAYEACARVLRRMLPAGGRPRNLWVKITAA